MGFNFFDRMADAFSGPDPSGRRFEERWVSAKVRLLDSSPNHNEREHDNALENVTELFDVALSRNFDHMLQLSRKVSAMELGYLFKRHGGYDGQGCSVPYGVDIDVERYSSELLLLVAIGSIHGGVVPGFGKVGDNPHFSARVFEYLSIERDVPQGYFFKGIMAKYGPMPQSAPYLDVAENSLQIALDKGVTSAALELENIRIHDELRNYKPAYYKVGSWDSWAKA